MSRTIMVFAISIFLQMCIHTQSACAQNQPNQPNISVVNLSVQTNAAGKQLVLTPRGFLVPLPGAGVITNIVQIYMGRDGGFWYVDWTGKAVDITSYVQQVRTQTDQVLQAKAAQGGAPLQQGTPPQYAPYMVAYPAGDMRPTNVQTVGSQAPIQQNAGLPVPVNQQIATNQQAVINQQAYIDPNASETSSENSSRGSGMGTALAAGVGAMAGSALANTAYYNNVPYGSRMYYGDNGRPYYNDDRGKGVFIDDGNVNFNNVYAANKIQDSRRQEKLDQLEGRRDQAHGGRSEMQQSAHQNRQRFEQQGDWYQEQIKDKGRAKSWREQSRGENPFVRRGGEGRNFASRGAGLAKRGTRAARGGLERAGGRARGGGGGRGR